MGDLAQKVLVDNSKMTRMVDYLESQSWAARRPDETDHRAQGVYLTAPGDIPMPMIEQRLALLAQQFRHDNTIRPYAPIPMNPSPTVTATSGVGVDVAYAEVWDTTDGRLPANLEPTERHSGTLRRVTQTLPYPAFLTAQADQNADIASWFIFHEWPHSYRCFLGLIPFGWRFTVN